MKRHRLVSLFKNNGFNFDNFSEEMGIPCGFSCPNSVTSACNVKVEENPIWTSALGGENAITMVVGEAPSFKEMGAKTGGLVERWMEKKGQREVNALFEFIRENYGDYPHFSDVVKCGVQSQGEEKDTKMLDVRSEICGKYFLKEEIKIVDLDIIFCVGGFSYDYVVKLIKEISGIKKIKIIKLTHYSGSARYSRRLRKGINLTKKIKYIWPLEAGLLTEEEVIMKMEKEDIM